MTGTTLITRNAIFGAVLAFAGNITWGAESFVTISRKWREPGAVSPDERPAIFQLEPVEVFEQTTGLPYKRTFDVVWLIYTNTDTDPKGTPGGEVQAAILDAIERAMQPDGPDDQQTLGGLVHHAWISGIVHKVSGDDNGLGAMLVPITLLIP